MKKGFANGVVGAAPALPDSWETGYPTDGDPLAPTEPTIPGAYWFHMIAESLERVITQAGLTPDPENLDLLKQAVSALAFSPASVADQIAATAANKAVTPAVQKHHSLHPKKFMRVAKRNTDGSCTFVAQTGGTARAERKGTGYYRVLFSTSGSADDMADANYVALVVAQHAASTPASVGAWGSTITATAGGIVVCNVTAQDSTGFVFKCESNGAAVAFDPDFFNVLILGLLP